MRIRRKNKKYSGQSLIEFSFAMIGIMLLIFGLVKIFQWVGLDLADRRIAHDKTLLEGATAEAQLNPNFSRVRRVDGVFRFWDFK